MTTTNLDMGNFEAVITKPGIVIVDAWASWCGPCRAFAPIFEAAAARHPGVVWASSTPSGPFASDELEDLCLLRAT